MDEGKYILNYGRLLPRDDQGIKLLNMSSPANAALADSNWRASRYVSEHAFQKPDMIMNVRVRNSDLDNTARMIISMNPTESNLYLTPSFWANVSTWLREDGIFVAICSDDHIIDEYLMQSNNQASALRHHNLDYSRLSGSDRSSIDCAYAKLRRDIRAWSGGLLKSHSDVDANLYLVNPDRDHRKFLGFVKVSAKNNL